MERLFRNTLIIIIIKINVCQQNVSADLVKQYNIKKKLTKGKLTT